MAAIPQEVLSVLAQIPPTLLESYAILQQPIEPKIREESGQTPMVEEPAPLLPRHPPVNQPVVVLVPQPGQVERGSLLYTPPPVTSVMSLDPFQGAYKGQVSVTQGRGKKATTKTRPIAVHKTIYEAEFAQVGSAVSDPSYWLPKHNAMTVYLPREEYEVEIGWLLGDYDPKSSGVLAGINPTPEQIAQWLSEGLDDEEWVIEVIKRHLRTPEQKAWLDQHDMSISDLLGGRHHHALDVDWILDEWNAKLGVKQFGF